MAYLWSGVADAQGAAVKVVVPEDIECRLREENVHEERAGLRGAHRLLQVGGHRRQGGRVGRRRRGGGLRRRRALAGPRRASGRARHARRARRAQRPVRRRREVRGGRDGRQAGPVRAAGRALARVVAPHVMLAGVLAAGKHKGNASRLSARFGRVFRDVLTWRVTYLLADLSAEGGHCHEGM